MKAEKGKWEDAIHSKIYNFEADTNPDDWEIISGKINPAGKTVKLNPFRRYSYMAAASIAAIIIVGGLYFFQGNDSVTDRMAIVEKPVENEFIISEKVATDVEKDEVFIEKPVDNYVNNSVGSTSKATTEENKKATLVAMNDVTVESAAQIIPLPVEDNRKETEKIPDTDIKVIENELLYGLNDISLEEIQLTEPLLADASSEIKRRRWGFGMGGGSYTVSSTSGVIGVEPRTMNINEYMSGINTIGVRNASQSGLLNESKTPAGIVASEDNSGTIKHKTPISLGFGVSYYLDDRWALQSGLIYSFLRSEGNDNIGNYEWNQKLHFVGVPLSLSYKIAEWKRFKFYASAGGMCEFNVAGKVEEIVNSDGVKITGSKNQRMDNPLWSVNVRAGVNYPLWKIINVYAEAGTAYYFDNKSNIETIRSDKPFNVSLQAGIRLGF